MYVCVWDLCECIEEQEGMFEEGFIWKFNEMTMAMLEIWYHYVKFHEMSETMLVRLRGNPIFSRNGENVSSNKIASSPKSVAISK